VGGSTGSEGQSSNVEGKPLAGSAAAYSSTSPSPSPIVTTGKNNATTNTPVGAAPPQGNSVSGSSSVTAQDDYVDDDDYNMDDYQRNSKWWVGPHSSVAGGSSQQMDKRPASRFSFGLSMWMQQQSTSGGTGSSSGTQVSHRELLVLFGGERGGK
jgi:hypothetical protein